ncbi:hypothetical protein ES332_A10G255300v1 [Gossypium tomentosum]|uniref:Uncharacterized protein n=1 Tax=Gossypium tomentosum TaxID=34277 RepID=A0A5D2NV42_GOSTO|nr:hypothetical protein ES332_A10G255300v1 [Gossypium tomentosum]
MKYSSSPTGQRRKIKEKPSFLCPKDFCYKTVFKTCFKLVLFGNNESHYNDEPLMLRREIEQSPCGDVVASRSR